MRPTGDTTKQKGYEYMGLAKIFRKTKTYRYGKLTKDNGKTVDARQCKRTNRVEYKHTWFVNGEQKFNWQVCGWGWEQNFTVN